MVVISSSSDDDTETDDQLQASVSYRLNMYFVPSWYLKKFTLFIQNDMETTQKGGRKSAAKITANDDFNGLPTKGKRDEIVNDEAVSFFIVFLCIYAITM